MRKYLFCIIQPCKEDIESGMDIIIRGIFTYVTYMIYKINYYLRKLGQEYLSNVTKSLYFLKGNLEYFIAHSMVFVCLDIKLSDTP